MASEDWAYMDSLRAPVYVSLRRKPSHQVGGLMPMVLDGRQEWQHVPWSDAFVDIEGPIRQPKEHPLTRFKMMHDDETLYVAAELIGPKVWGTITERNSTMYHENDFEVFFNPDGSRHHYYIENPSNLVSLRSAVFVDGVANSPETECKRWRVELSWSLAELQQFDRQRLRVLDETPSTVAGDVWRVNFSRVEYELGTVVKPETQQLQFQKVPDRREDNIVWAPTGVVDIHRPERWGYVYFSSQDELSGGESELASAMSEFLEQQMAIESVLDAVYYAQRAFFEVHGAFASTMERLYGGVSDSTEPLTAVERTGLEAFPLWDVLHRYELSFPELSCKSDVVNKEPGVSTRSEGEDVKDSDVEPCPCPRSLEAQKLEAQGFSSNFTVSTGSATQQWHLTHDGRLWRTT
ncbi:hypothetical protein BBJ28_00012520 [Nothophytophthora sp. Chile5]|nr:hypothetical protein BBJ28_00012520 [Nothophytophthora sp. Chile5]